eukprot:145607-Pelagomonas_calceolata.AAC.1
MAKSSEHAAGPFMASAFRVCRLFARIFWQIGHVCLCGLGRRMWFQLECMQAKCGSIKVGKEFASDLQVRHMSYLAIA